MAGKTLTILDASELQDMDLASILDYAKTLSVDVNDETESIVGLPIIGDKATLVNVPFFLVSWSFRTGDIGEFVSCVIADKDGRKAVLNDGSTGILAQLRGLTQERVEKGHPTPQALRMIGKGLRRSDYTYTDDKGESKKATTYYLAG